MMKSMRRITAKSITKAIAFFAVAIGAFYGYAANKPGYVVKPSAIVPVWSGAEAGKWTMDYQSALENAERDGKFTLMMFSGMWWCPHCQALESTVLDTDDFRSYVDTNGFYLVSMDYPYRDGYSNSCWLWDEDYRQTYCGGMTAEAGTNTVNCRYAVQDEYSVPGAARQQVPIYSADGTVIETINYGRVGYPTLLVIRPGGQVIGRFSVSKTVASYEYVVSRINQLLKADDWDERDDYWQNATSLPEPAGEDVVQTNGYHTLGLTDKTDWFSVDITSGANNLWSFQLVFDNPPAEGVTVAIYQDPTAVPMASKTIFSASEALDVIIPQNGTYYLKVSHSANPKTVIGYDFSYGYSVNPATVKFKSNTTQIASSTSSVSIPVEIANGTLDSEVVLDWISEDMTASNGVDFVSEGGSLVWAAGEDKKAKSITIPLIPSSVWKGNREFQVRLVPRRHCFVAEHGDMSVVMIKESRVRAPGNLSFDADAARKVPVIREGEVVEFPVYRIGGADGVVTGTVVIAEGAAKLAPKTLVWANGDAEPKYFSYEPERKSGIQNPVSGTMTLTVGGGAKRGKPSAMNFSLYDEWMDRSFNDFNRDVLQSKASIKGGIWFYGRSEYFDTPTLRSGILDEQASRLSVKFAGPGVLRLQLGVYGGAKVGVTLEKKLLEEGVDASGELVLAIPAGNKTLNLDASGVEGGSAFVSVDWKWHPLSGLKLVPTIPYGKSVVKLDGEVVLKASLSDANAFDGLADVGLVYSVFGGPSSSKMEELPSAGTTFPLTDEGGFLSEADSVRFEELLESVIGKSFYWRMDVGFTDAYGDIAEVKGAIGNFQVIGDGVPSLDLGGDLPVGSVADAVSRSISVPELYLGVATRFGPLPVSGTSACDTISAAVKNGKLPAGLKIEVDESGVWIAGVPQAAGEYGFDLLLSGKAAVGKRTQTINGASVHLNGEVVSLGELAAVYEGYRVDDVTHITPMALQGAASLTLSAKGAISGKLTLDGTNVTVKVANFTSLDGSVYTVTGATVKVGKTLMPVEIQMESAEHDGKFYDIRLQIGTATFWLFRNKWKTDEGKLLIGQVVGSYTAALPVLASEPEAAPQGIGYLMANIKDNGMVAYSGVDSLGKAFSGSSPVWYVQDCCNLSGYRWVFYVCAKPSGSSVAGAGCNGLIQIDIDETSPLIRYLTCADDAKMTVVNLTPKSIAAFTCWTNRLDVIGGSYDSKAPLTPASVWEQDTAQELAEDYDGVHGTSGYLLRSSPSKLVLSAVTSSKAEFADNEWQARFGSIATATGLFTAQFTLTYDNSAARTKTRKVSVKGVLVQHSALGAPFFSGYFALPDKGVSVSARGVESKYSCETVYPISFK